MARTSTTHTLGALNALQRRVEGWRRNRMKPARMPESLWSTAAELAKKHGVNPVARALRLDYYSLKKRLDSSSGSSAAGFVEVALPPAGWGPVTTLEIDRADGSRLRVQAGGEADLVRELALAFLERA